LIRSISARTSPAARLSVASPVGLPGPLPVLTGRALFEE